MKKKLNNQYVRWGLTAFGVIAAGICFYYLIFRISNLLANFTAIIQILMPIMFGLIMAYILTPLLNFIEQKVLIPFFDLLKIKESQKRKRGIRWIGVLITAFLFFAIIYLLIALLLSQIVPSINKIAMNFDTYVSNISTWLDELLENNEELKEFTIKNINKYSNDLELWLNETVLSKTSEVIKTVSLSVINVLAF